jgi:site-specific DNA recombinase
VSEYYFLPKPGTDSDHLMKSLRLPAYDVERQVCAKLQSLLQSTNEVVKFLCVPEDEPEIAQQLITGAKKLADELSTASPSTILDFVRKIVRRVVVHADNIDVEASRAELRASVIRNHSGAPGRIPSKYQEKNFDDLIRLRIEARVKRCGKEMRLVIAPDSSTSQTMTPILKAVARAHQWREGVLAGDTPNRKLAAERLGLEWEHFRRIVSCAFLAPDILEAILEGRYPSDLTVNKLCWSYLPLDLTEQRIQLGFPPVSSRGKFSSGAATATACLVSQ